MNAIKCIWAAVIYITTIYDSNALCLFFHLSFVDAFLLFLTTFLFNSSLFLRFFFPFCSSSPFKLFLLFPFCSFSPVLLLLLSPFSSFFFPHSTRRHHEILIRIARFIVELLILARLIAAVLVFRSVLRTHVHFDSDAFPSSASSGHNFWRRTHRMWFTLVLHIFSRLFSVVVFVVALFVVLEVVVIVDVLAVIVVVVVSVGCRRRRSVLMNAYISMETPFHFPFHKNFTHTNFYSLQILIRRLSRMHFVCSVRAFYSFFFWPFCLILRVFLSPKLVHVAFPSQFNCPARFICQLHFHT